MGIARGLGKLIGTLLFTTFLTVSLLMIGLVEFTSYSNLKSFTGKILSDSIASQTDINQIFSTLKQNCSNKEFADFQLGNSILKLKCSELGSMQAKDLPNLIASTLFDSIYYRKYDCNFLDCIRQGGIGNLVVVLSEHANNFLKSLQSTLWILTVAGAGILYFSTETMKGRLRAFGINLIFTGGSFFVLLYAIRFLLPPQILQANIDISDILDSLFGPVRNYFIIVLVIGMLLMILSYIAVPKVKPEKKRKKR